MDTISSAMSKDAGLRRSAFDADPVPARLGHHDHAVSWPAVLAGAAGAAALSLILVILGTGLGLSSISPWVDHGVSASTLGTSTIVWITLTQLAASALGGYLAGRLRGRWSDTQADEVYFRDTAHGFLAWAIATLVTAALLTTATASILGAGAKAGAALVGGGATAAVATAGAAAAQGAMPGMPGMPGTPGTPGMSSQAGGDAMKMSNAYYIDSLFRPDPAAATAAAAAPGASPAAASTTAASSMSGMASNASSNASSNNSSNTEATAIFVNALKTGTLPPEDAAYLGQKVSQQTGMSQQDAQKRVTDTFARMQAKAHEAATTAQEAADKARKASAYAALWLFVSLLLGAFGASLMATFGGRQRDLP
ncbi:MAG TPA: hypothetical protein VGM81_11745 [Burkholderiaceae bacterium]|jgi:hypothetical protein